LKKGGEERFNCLVVKLIFLIAVNVKSGNKADGSKAKRGKDVNEDGKVDYILSSAGKQQIAFGQ
jgi:hypothetical protein